MVILFWNWQGLWAEDQTFYNLWEFFLLSLSTHQPWLYILLNKMIIFVKIENESNSLLGFKKWSFSLTFLYFFRQIWHMIYNFSLTRKSWMNWVYMSFVRLICGPHNLQDSHGIYARLTRYFLFSLTHIYMSYVRVWLCLTRCKNFWFCSHPWLRSTY